MSVASIEDALECVEWYCRRWQVDFPQDSLKSLGCQVEQRRLHHFDRLQPCIALFLDRAAWRIHWMTWMLRAQPDAPWHDCLADGSGGLCTPWRRGSADPDNIPSVEQVILWIAQLGGFLRRKEMVPQASL